jgi:excisionase family DNA binding protein
MNERSYRISELSAKVSISKKTIWNWVHLGKLNSVKVGCTYRIRDEDWQAFLADSNKR